MFLGGAETYSPEKYELIEPEIIYWCRRQTPDEDLRSRLFCYYARKHGTFVVGLWTDCPKGKFVDVLNMGFSLGNFDRSMAESLRKNLLAPLRTDETIQILMSAQRDYERHTTDEAQEQSETLRRNMRKAGYPDDTK